MKHAIIIIAMAAGLAHGQFHVVAPPTKTNGLFYEITYETTNNIIPPTDGQIQALIADGSVCRVRGRHEWVFIVDVDERPALRISQHDKRKCFICGRKESKHEVWKEDGK